MHWIFFIWKAFLIGQLESVVCITALRSSCPHHLQLICNAVLDLSGNLANWEMRGRWAKTWGEERGRLRQGEGENEGGKGSSGGKDTKRRKGYRGEKGRERQAGEREEASRKRGREKKQGYDSGLILWELTSSWMLIKAPAESLHLISHTFSDPFCVSFLRGILPVSLQTK